MHLGSRLILPLFGGAAVVFMVFALYHAAMEMHAMREEVQRQTLVLAESQQRPAEQVLQRGSPVELHAFVDQVQNHQRMPGVAIYDANGQPLALTRGLANRLSGTPRVVARATRRESSPRGVPPLPGRADAHSRVAS